MNKTSFELRYPIPLSDTRGYLGEFKSVKQFLFFFKSFLDFKLTLSVNNFITWSFNGFQEKCGENRKFSDDALTKKMIRYASTFFSSSYFVTNMPMYPLLNNKTLKKYYGATAFGFERKPSGSTRESGIILYFLLGMYWIQRERGRTRVTGLVPSDVVALLLICPKVLLKRSLDFCHLRRQNGTTTFSFICF